MMTEVNESLQKAVLRGMTRIDRVWDDHDRSVQKANDLDGSGYAVPYPTESLFGAAMLLIAAMENYIIDLEQKLGSNKIEQMRDASIAHMKEPVPPDPRPSARQGS